MNVKRILALAFSFSLLMSLTVHAQTQWLHVRVQEGASESVKVNVPLALLETVLPMVEEEHLNAGKVKIDSKELSVSEMREIWSTLKSQGDFELATITSEDANVRVSLEGNTLYVRSVEGSDTDVTVVVPGEVVDALLSGEGEELNIHAAVQALIALGGGELVKVKESDKLVRVWIDSTSSGE